MYKQFVIDVDACTKLTAKKSRNHWQVVLLEEDGDEFEMYLDTSQLIELSRELKKLSEAVVVEDGDVI